jgi:hypothetical protein
MAVGLSSSVATSLLNIFRGTNWTAPSAVYVQLHTGDPGAAGTANISVGSTTRIAATWAAPSGTPLSIVLNGTLPAWTNGGTSETLTHVSLWSAATSGTFLDSAQLSSSTAWASGNVFTLNTLTGVSSQNAA